MKEDFLEFDGNNKKQEETMTSNEWMEKSDGTTFGNFDEGNREG